MAKAAIACFTNLSEPSGLPEYVAVRRRFVSASGVVVLIKSCQFSMPPDCCQKAMSNRWLVSFPSRWAAALDQPSLLIALATLAQASEFLASGRCEVPNVNGLVRILFRQDLFETPTLIP